MKLHKIDTILFDLDGTLVNSNELIIKTFDETMKKYMPERAFSRDELIEMIGPPLQESFKVVTEDPKIVEEMIEYYRMIYVKLESDYLDIYPNVVETLKILSENGFNLGVVTTKFKRSAVPSIEYYGLDEYIVSYCYLDDVSEHKPHPEPIFYALKQFSSVSGAMMVGDNASDILAGRNAGIKTCGVEWSIKKDQIKKLHPDFWLDDFSELINIIEKYNKEE